MALFTSLWDVFPVFTSVLVMYIAHFYYRYLTRPNALPGPLPLPVLGNLHQILRSDLARFAENLHAKYGDMYEIYIGGERNICVASVRMTELLLNQHTNSPFFMRGYNDELVELGVPGKGVSFNNDLHSWRFNRKVLMRTITSPQFLDNYGSSTCDLFDHLDGFWFKLANTDVAEIDLAPWMKRFTSDTIINSITGEESYALAGYYNLLAPPERCTTIDKSFIADSERFVQQLQLWTNVMTFFIFVPAWMRNHFPPTRWFRNHYLNTMNRLKSELLTIIRTRKQEIDATPKDVPLSEDLLTFLVTARTDRDPNRDPEDDEVRPLTEDELQMLMLDIFFVGSDTTANAFCFIVYFICKHEHVLERVCEELDRMFGKGSARRRVKFEDLERMKYCDAVIKEAQRLLPVVPIGFKHLSRKTDFAGYTWQSGLEFLLINGVLHKDPASWREPERFDPDRWFRDDIGKNSYLPFGSGVRICAGKQVAYTQLKVLIAELFGRYDVELTDRNAPLDYKFYIINQCTSLPIRIRRRHE